MTVTIMALNVFVALWLIYRVVLVPIVYTNMGRNNGGKLSRAWGKNLIALVWMPVCVGVIFFIGQALLL